MYQKIAVLRALQLGDLLCAIPAIRALRHAYPHTEITLLGLPWAKSLVERFPNYFNRFILFPGYPGLPEQTYDAQAFEKFLSTMNDEHFDLVLQMQGNGSIVNAMVELFGARCIAGFKPKDEHTQDKNLFLEYPEGIHEISRHLLLMKHLGIESTDTDLEFPLYQKDYDDLQNAGLKIEPGQYVCIHPGSRGAWRQWPARYFAKCADHCASKGLTVVLTGTKEEMDIINKVWQDMKYEPVIAAGKTSLGAVAALIKNALALVSNCTGVSHIAAAFKTPGVIISMDGEPERWAPLNKQLHKTIDWTTMQDFNAVYSELKKLISAAVERERFKAVAS